MNVVVLLVLLFLGWFLNLMAGRTPTGYGDQAVVVLGFALIGAAAVGRLARRGRLPMITGYLLAGLAFGPHLAGSLSPQLTLFTPEVLQQLRLIDDLALGLIAFTAGGELKMSTLRPRLRAILAVSGVQALVVTLGVGLVAFALGPHLSFLAGKPQTFWLAAAIVLGITALAPSPATTIAVINESEARGPFATVAMGTTVTNDVLSLLLFSGSLMFVNQLLQPETAVDLAVLGLVVWEVLGSLIAGLLLGLALRGYIRHIGRELPLLILALAFVSMQAAAALHLSGILVCLAAGFYVENFTAHGEAMITAVDRYSLPVYIVFFTLAGAKIDLPVLRQMWAATLILVLARGLFLFAGARLGGRLGRAEPTVRREIWKALVGQAGISLGLAVIVGQSVPEIGPALQTLLIALIAVHQLIGPILLRQALARSGEAKP